MLPTGIEYLIYLVPDVYHLSTIFIFLSMTHHHFQHQHLVSNCSIYFGGCIELVKNVTFIFKIIILTTIFDF